MIVINDNVDNVIDNNKRNEDYDYDDDDNKSPIFLNTLHIFINLNFFISYFKITLFFLNLFSSKIVTFTNLKT